MIRSLSVLKLDDSTNLQVSLAFFLFRKMMSTQRECEDSVDIKKKIVRGKNMKGCFSSFLGDMGKSIYKD